jgi:hypothetical protein
MFEVLNAWLLECLWTSIAGLIKKFDKQPNSGGPAWINETKIVLSDKDKKDCLKLLIETTCCDGCQNGLVVHHFWNKISLQYLLTL